MDSIFDLNFLHFANPLLRNSQIRKTTISETYSISYLDLKEKAQKKAEAET